MKERDFYGVKKLIDENGGIEHFRCFVQMGIVEAAIPWMGISMVSGDKQSWTECFVDESRYKVEDGYKITLRSTDPHFSYEHYYQSDFMSLVKSGHIIVKTSDNMRIEHVTVAEPLCGCAIIRHEGDIVAAEKN